MVNMVPIFMNVFIDLLVILQEVVSWRGYTGWENVLGYLRTL